MPVADQEDEDHPEDAAGGRVAQWSFGRFAGEGFLVRRNVLTCRSWDGCVPRELLRNSPTYTDELPWYQTSNSFFTTHYFKEAFATTGF